MKRHIQVAMLGLIVLVMGVIAACGSGPEIPDDVSYEIKHVEKGGSDDSSGPHHQDSGEAKIRESTAGVSRKPSSDGKARGCSSKQLSGLTAWNT